VGGAARFRRIGLGDDRHLPVRTNPPSANLYITYPTQDDAPVVRAFLKILHPAGE